MSEHLRNPTGKDPEEERESEEGNRLREAIRKLPEEDLDPDGEGILPMDREYFYDLLMEQQEQM